MSDHSNAAHEELGPSRASKSPAPESLFDFFPAVRWARDAFDYLGGSRETPPPGAAVLASACWIGIWWGLLAGLILLFCGQTSKFIYIDF